MTRVLNVAAAGRAVTGERGAIAVVLRWEGGAAPRVVVRRLRRNDPVSPAYRALLLALWEARRMGARAVVLGTDDPDVVAQLSSGGTPSPEAIGPYLQIRALLHAFRSAELRYMMPGWDRDAATAADAAERPGQPVYTDLPLWVCAPAS